jgi:hypothetical protein
LGKIGEAIADTKPDYEVVEDGHIMPGLTERETSIVFVEGHITPVMQTVFNAPVTTEAGSISWEACSGDKLVNLHISRVLPDIFMPMIRSRRKTADAGQSK